MKKRVTVCLKGQKFNLTCEELQQHVLACCDIGLVHFGTHDSATAFVDKTQVHRQGLFFSQQNGRSESTDDDITVDY